MAVASSVEQAAARLLDFSQPVDVPLLEQVVDAASQAAGDQRSVAEAILLKFQEHPSAYQTVDAILSAATQSSTKYFALQVGSRRIYPRSHDFKRLNATDPHSVKPDADGSPVPIDLPDVRRSWRTSSSLNGAHCQVLIP